MKLHPLLGDPNSDYINANYIDVSGGQCLLPCGVKAGTGASRGPRVCPAALGGAETAQNGLDHVALRHAVKSLPDLFMFVSNLCLLCLSLLCLSVSLLFLPLFHSLFSPHLLSVPWISLLPGWRMQRLRGPRDQLGAQTGTCPDPVGTCESGQSLVLVSSESDVPQV